MVGGIGSEGQIKRSLPSGNSAVEGHRAMALLSDYDGNDDLM